MARSSPPLTSAFVAELARRLQGQGAALALPLTWLEQRLAEHGQTIEQLVQAESQQPGRRPGLDRATASAACASSARSTGATSSRRSAWSSRRCAHDPAGVYARDGLRDARPLPPRGRGDRQAQPAQRSRGGARGGRRSRRGGGSDAAARRAPAHVGYYLIDDGRAAARARRAHARVAAVGRVRRAARAPHALPLYARRDRRAHARCSAWRWRARRSAGDASPAGLASALLALALLLAPASSRSRWSTGLATLLVAPAAAAAAGLLGRAFPPSRARWSWCRRCSPSARGIDELLEALEVRFLANRDAQSALRACSPTSATPRRRRCRATRRCCDARATAIEALNAKYARRRGAAPLLPVPPPAALEPARRRLDGLRAQARQAGGAQCAAARRRAASASSRIVGDTARAAERALRHHARHRHAAAARRGPASWSATMAHPLNRPRFDAQRAARRRGLRHPAAARRRQPAERAAARASRGCSPASRASTPTRAPSPTSTRTCSAKARSSARASTTSTPSSRRSAARLPENRILSHDLLEGCYARSGLVSDVRAVRGLPVALPRRRQPAPPLDPRRLADRAVAAAARARRPSGARARTRSRALSRWKIFDNLRRSLVPAALLVAAAARLVRAAAAAGCGRSCGARDRRSCRRWRCSSTLVAARARRAAAAAAPARDRRDRSARQLVRRSLLALACLPYEAVVSLRRDRPHARGACCVTRAPAAGVDDRPATRERGAARRPAGIVHASMWIAPALAVGVAALPGAAAARRRCRSRRRCCALWLARAGRRLVARAGRCRAARLALTRRADVASCAGSRAGPGASSRPSSAADDHWLPPDNVQEQPAPRVAHRTSPTNIGLALLAEPRGVRLRLPHAGAAARAHRRDARRRWQRWSATAATSTTGTTRRRCSRCAPRYVSTVDSGNLAGHLLTLRAGLLALADDAALPPRLSRRPARHARRAARGARPRRRGAAARRSRSRARDGAATTPRTLAARAPRARAGAGASTLAGTPAERRRARWWATRCAASAGAPRRLGCIAPWPTLPTRSTTRQLRDCALDAARPCRRCATRARAELDGAAALASRAATGDCRRRPALTAARRPCAGAARAAPTARGARAARRARRRARRHGLRLPLRPDARPARDRLQRRRPPPRRELLRPARVGGAAGQLRRDRPGQAAAGALVRARPPAHHGRRRAGAAVVERLDVRVPDAAAGDADATRTRCSTRPARRSCSRQIDYGRAARRAVGHLRVGLQHDRRAPELPVPRLRRAGPGPQARAGRRPGDRAVRHARWR